MEHKDDYFIGEIIRIDPEKVYIKSTDFSYGAYTYLIFKDKIYKTPYIGSFVKVYKNQTLYLLQIKSEKLIINEKSKYKLFICGIYGEFELSNKPNLTLEANFLEVNLPVYLLSNDELDKIDQQQRDSKVYLTNLGTIKDSGSDFALTINFFSSNSLFLGSNGYGRNNFLNFLYLQFFKKFLDKIENNTKFIFYDFNDRYKELFKELLVDQPEWNDKIAKIDFNLKTTSLKLFSRKALKHEDFYLLGKILREEDKDFAQKFYEWDHKKHKEHYIRDIFLGIDSDFKILRYLKNSIDYLYQNQKIKFNQNHPFTRKEKITNNIISNAKVLVNYLFIKDNKLFLNSRIFGKHTNFKKSLLNLKRFKHLDNIEINQNNMKFLLRFVFYLDRKNKYDFLQEVENLVSKDFTISLNLFACLYMLKNKRYDLEKIDNFIENFLNSWKRIDFLFCEQIDEKDKIVWNNSNILLFDFNFNNLEEKNIISTFIAKKLYQKFKLITSEQKMMSFIIDDAQKLFLTDFDNVIYYQQIKIIFLNWLISHGRDENIYVTFSISNFLGMNTKILLHFQNFFLFHIITKTSLSWLLNNFNIVEKEQLNYLERLGYGEFICFGKNFNRTLNIQTKQLSNFGKTKERNFIISDNLIKK